MHKVAIIISAGCILATASCTNPSKKHYEAEQEKRRSIYTVEYIVAPECSITGRVEGKVTDKSTGKALVQARIWMLDTESIDYSDSSGYYLLDNIPPGKYNITASLMAYNKAKAENIQIKLGYVTIINFQLAWGAQGMQEKVKAPK